VRLLPASGGSPYRGGCFPPARANVRHRRPGPVAGVDSSGRAALRVFPGSRVRRRPDARHGDAAYNQNVTHVPHLIAERRARVLVVDDEPGVVSFVARALQARSFDVDVAGGGDEALTRLADRRYDVVLLDLRMPGTNGVVVLKELMRTHPEQRVVVVSAAAETRIKVRCLELGASDFVAKPFELAELLARVGAQTRRPRPVERPEEERVVRVGRLELDLDARAVRPGDGLPVALPSREFLLLRHLARRAGEACTREELLAEVWGTRFDAGTNVVDTSIHRLRQKLGPATIETVRNVGYRLVG
jgi:two-component system, OmpR family, response regulator